MAPTCALQGPTGTAPTTPVCGDGFRTGAEECDDQNLLSDDACSSTCMATPQLIVPRTAPAVGMPPLGARDLGGSRHPIAAGCNSVGLSLVDHSGALPALQLAVFSALGRFVRGVPLGTAAVDQPAPAVAAFGDDTFAVAWTDFESDGDELGVRLAKLSPSAMTQVPAGFANVTTEFSQRAPDVVFDGTELVVAWVDDSDPVNGPDIRYRTFKPDLTPLSDEQTLTATAAVEDHVSLAAANGAWAAAWRSGNAGSETLEIQSGATHWSVGPYKPGADDDIPALSFIDATHLAVAFTMVDPTQSDQNIPRLHAAILDAAFPGATESFAVIPAVAPYSTDVTLSQTKPSLLVFPDRMFVSWRSAAVPGSALGDELWRREITWSPDGMGNLLVDASAAEVPLVPSANRAGDQSDPTLLSSPFWPEKRTFSAWDDLGKSFGAKSGVEDVALQVTSSPPPSCAASSLVTSTEGPVAAGVTVNVSAVASCPIGSSPSYRFAYAPANTTNYTYLTSWGTTTSAVWDTTNLPGAAYDVLVFVRTSTATVGYDSVLKKTITVNAPPPCSVDTLSDSPSGPVAVATSIGVTATGHCPSGATPNYRFAYAPTGTTSYTYFTGWGAAASAAWDTTGVAQGSYDIVAFVRPSASTGTYDGLKTKAIELRNQCTGGTLSINPPEHGTVLTLTGAASSCLDPRYSYSYAPAGTSSWTPIGSPWVTGAVSWNTSAITPGSYTIKVEVAELGFASNDTTATITRQVGPTCYAVTDPGDYTGGHPQPAGESYPFSSVATCDSGLTPEYSFYYAPPDGEFQLFPGTDWQSSGSALLDTSGFESTGMGFATYAIQVRVRAVGHTSSAEATADGGLTIDDP